MKNKYALRTVRLDNGRLLHCLVGERLEDSAPIDLGHFEVTPGGVARLWRQTSVDRYSSTETWFPGPISAIRAIIDGVA